MDSHGVSLIIVIIVLVIMSGYFSATETSFMSLNRIRLKNMASNGDKRAGLVLKLSEEYDKLLSTILIGNNIVNIVMTTISTVLFVRLVGEAGPTVSSIVMTLVVLVFGEISPKSLAKEAPERFAKFSAPVIRVCIFLIAPINWLFSKWKLFLGKIFKVPVTTAITEEELITIVEEAETEGTIDEEQRELIQNAIQFNELTVWDIITPRTDVIAIEAGSTKDELKNIFKETGFSRVPVYDDNIDHILGVINQKDFHNFVAVKANVKIVDYIKPVVYTTGTAKIAVLLKKMQKSKTHIAVAIDEYGGTIGIVTMEDIIEELVGDIWDEFDDVVSQGIMRLPDGSYKVMCNADLEDIFKFFDVSDDVDASTVNGWIVVKLDKIPEVGDHFTYDRLEIKVTAATDKKALEANIKVRPKADEEDEE